MSKILLIAPENFWKMTPAERKENCNGCGAKDGFNAPDTMYGLDIGEACNIHDFMYGEGVTSRDKVIADEIFEHNLRAIIDSESYWFMKPLRYIRAKEYFAIVKHFGSDAYWRDKVEGEYDEKISIYTNLIGLI